MRIAKLNNLALRIKEYFKKKIVESGSRNFFFLLTCASISIYTVVFSYFTALKHYAFATYAWDLGVFNQAIYTTIFQGKFFYYTPDLYINTSGNYFAIHFSPILLLVLPVYAIYPSPITLLVLKSFILAMGALPLYLLTKEFLNNEKAAFTLALAYLLYPGLQGSNWFDFQPQIFIPLLIFSLIYFMKRERWKLYFTSTVLALMISEQTIYLVLLLAAYYFLTSGLKKVPESIKRLKVTQGTASVLTIGFGISFLIVSTYVKGSFPIAPDFLEFYKATGVYEVLGFKGSLTTLPFYIISNLNRVYEALTYDYTIKLFYIILLFAPLLFLPFGSKLSLVTLVLLIPFMFSNYKAYYMIGAHYPLYVLTPIFLATVETLSKKARKDLRRTLRMLMITTMLFIISVSPLSPVSNTFIGQNMVWYPVPHAIDENIEAMHEVANLIPANASILTQSHIFPQVSKRINAYVIPVTTYPPEQMDILRNYIREMMSKSDYVLLDFLQRDYWTSFVFDEVNKNNDFGTYAYSKWAVLLKKNFNGTAIVMPAKEERETLLAHKDLSIASGKIVKDDTSKSNLVVFQPKGSQEGLFVYGPFVYLPPGVFNVTFLAKVGEHSDGYIATFQVRDGQNDRILAERTLFGFEIEPNKWINFTVTFSLTKARSRVEFKVESAGVADIYLDQVEVKQSSAKSIIEFGTLIFDYKKLVSNGNVTSEKIMVHPNGNIEDISFWYGPYTALPPGKYRVSFFLKTSPIPQQDDEILTVDVSCNIGLNVVTKIDLNGRDLTNKSIGLGWSKITLDFTLETSLEKVEFRGRNPSAKYDIFLAYVLVEREIEASLTG